MACWAGDAAIDWRSTAGVNGVSAGGGRLPEVALPRPDGVVRLVNLLPWPDRCCSEGPDACWLRCSLSLSRAFSLQRTP